MRNPRRRKARRSSMGHVNRMARPASANPQAADTRAQEASRTSRPCPIRAAVACRFAQDVLFLALAWAVSLAPLFAQAPEKEAPKRGSLQESAEFQLRDGADQPQLRLAGPNARA